MTGKRTEAFSLTNDRYPGAPGTALYKAREQALKAVLAAKREMAKLAAKKAELEHLLGVGSVGSAMLGIAPGSVGAAAIEALSGMDVNGANGHAALVKEYTSALGKRQRKSASPYTSIPSLSVTPSTGGLAAVAAAASVTGAQSTSISGPASKRARSSNSTHTQTDRASSEQPRGSSAADGDGFIGSHLPNRVRRPASRGSSPVPLTAQQSQQAAPGSGAVGAAGDVGTEGAAAGSDALSTLIAATTTTSTGSTQRRGASSLSKEIKPIAAEDEEEEEDGKVEGNDVPMVDEAVTTKDAAAATTTTNNNSNGIGTGYDSDASTTSATAAGGRRSGGGRKKGGAAKRLAEERSPLLKGDEQLPSIVENEAVEPQSMAV